MGGMELQSKAREPSRRADGIASWLLGLPYTNHNVKNVSFGRSRLWSSLDDTVLQRRFWCREWLIWVSKVPRTSGKPQIPLPNKIKWTATLWFYRSMLGLLPQTPWCILANSLSRRIPTRFGKHTLYKNLMPFRKWCVALAARFHATPDLAHMHLCGRARTQCKILLSPSLDKGPTMSRLSFYSKQLKFEHQKGKDSRKKQMSSCANFWTTICT